MQPGRGAQMVRSAGNSAQLMGRDNGYAQVRLPSGEVRLINEQCTASMGVIGNNQHQNIKIGKAGSNRHRGIRPSVRGVVMNAVDHPHGGGDGGRHGIGGGKNHGSAPKTPWGQKTLGYKTRRRKSTTKYIVRSRHAAKEEIRMSESKVTPIDVVDLNQQVEEGRMQAYDAAMALFENALKAGAIFPETVLSGALAGFTSEVPEHEPSVVGHANRADAVAYQNYTNPESTTVGYLAGVSLRGVK